MLREEDVSKEAAVLSRKKGHTNLASWHISYNFFFQLKI